MKTFLLLTSVLILTASVAAAGTYNFVSPEALKQSLEEKESLLLLDIQVEKEYAQHHLEGAVATYAYPVKSDRDRAKLKPLLTRIKADQTPVVVICPRGGGGAKRTNKLDQNLS